MLVKDIMTTSVRTARPDTAIRDVAVTMCFNKISGMPVTDDENRIVGIISEKDLLHAMYPDMSTYVEGGRVDFEALEGEYKDVLSNRVDAVMKKPVITARPDDPILRAVSIMCLNKIRRIPVSDDNGHLVGILSMGDVHKAIFQANAVSVDSTRKQDASPRLASAS